MIRIKEKEIGGIFTALLLSGLKPSFWIAAERFYKFYRFYSQQEDGYNKQEINWQTSLIIFNTCINFYGCKIIVNCLTLFLPVFPYLDDAVHQVWGKLVQENYLFKSSQGNVYLSPTNDWRIVEELHKLAWSMLETYLTCPSSQASTKAFKKVNSIHGCKNRGYQGF